MKGASKQQPGMTGATASPMNFGRAAEAGPFGGYFQSLRENPAALQQQMEGVFSNFQPRPQASPVAAPQPAVMPQQMPQQAPQQQPSSLAMAMNPALSQPSRGFSGVPMAPWMNRYSNVR